MTASVAYTCSKYAMTGLTMQLAPELAEHGITVNTVSPGLIHTEELEAAYDKALEGKAKAQREAILSLGKTKIDKGVKVLTKLLDHKSYAVEGAAASTLATQVVPLRGAPASRIRCPAPFKSGRSWTSGGGVPVRFRIVVRPEQRDHPLVPKGPGFFLLSRGPVDCPALGDQALGQGLRRIAVAE